MANILTAQQAANALRVETTDARMLDLLPQVDLFIQRATGRDWTQDAVKNVIAVSAATMLLVQWYENPSQLGLQITDAPLSFGLIAALTQLEAEALRYRKYQFRGLSNAGRIGIPGAQFGDDVISLTGVHGVSGDQRASFESEISVAGSLLQTDTGNLYLNLYVVVLKSPQDDVIV